MVIHENPLLFTSLIGLAYQKTGMNAQLLNSARGVWVGERESDKSELHFVQTVAQYC